MSYREHYLKSLEDPDGYWGKAAGRLVWSRPWDRVLDASDAPYYAWFTGGEINSCYNALDRHCENGRGAQAALIYDSPVRDRVETFSYDELRDTVARCAGALRAGGVEQGDRVVIYMPMIPEAVVAMLACARIGAVHSVVFGGFAANELAARVTDAQPRLVISASCGLEGSRVIAYLPLLEAALALAGQPELPRIVVSRPELPIENTAAHTRLWNEAMEAAQPVGTPDAGAFWRVIEQHKVKCLFTAPTAFRAIRQQDSRGELLATYDLSSLKTLFLAGERCDPDTLHWAETKLEVPVIDHWWQTETGWPMAANPMGIEPLPVKAGSPTVAVPGYDIRVLDDAGRELDRGQSGNIVVKLPLPPGTLSTLWGDRQRFYDAYLARFEGYYLTGDAGVLDEEGYLWVMSRIDDVINVAGHRLSTGALEEALATHPDVAECAVIGVEDKLKGEMPLGFVVLNSGAGIDPEQLRKELMQAVRSQVGPIATPRDILIVKRLPKTRSGKILRATMRKIADHEEYMVPPTIEDPGVLQELAAALREAGEGGP